MKAIKRKDLLAMIYAKGGIYVGCGRHDKFVIVGKSFPLPNSREISPGVLRDLRKFTGIDFAQLLKAN